MLRSSRLLDVISTGFSWALYVTRVWLWLCRLFYTYTPSLCRSIIFWYLIFFDHFSNSKFFKLTICFQIQSFKTRILTACVSNMTRNSKQCYLWRFFSTCKEHLIVLNCWIVKNKKNKKHQSFLTFKKKAFLTVQTVPNGLTVFPWTKAD